MPREKEHFREVVAEIKEETGKTLLGVNDIKRYLKVGHNKAVGYLDGKKDHKRVSACTETDLI